jgi:hypothetical protein
MLMLVRVRVLVLVLVLMGRMTRILRGRQRRRIPFVNLSCRRMLRLLGLSLSLSLLGTLLMM